MGNIELDMDLKLLQEPVNNLTNPIAKSAGQTLQDLWDLVFGGIHTFVEKKRFKREKDLIDFKNSLEKEILQIPEEQIKEPSLSVIGPALEASKYYYEEYELRDMFAKLVAASMDKRKENCIHPCFVEIIKQLSPNDAKILSLFNSQQALPVGKIRKIAKDGGIYAGKTRANIFVHPDFQNVESNQLSLTSLERASLIQLDYREWLIDDSLYVPISEYGNIEYNNKRAGWEMYTLVKGIAKTTPLGDAFIHVCL